MKTIPLLIIALFSISIAVNSEVIGFQTQRSDYYESLNAEMEAREIAFSLEAFIKDVESLINEIYLIREVVPRSPFEEGQVFDLLSKIETGPICNSCQHAVEALRKISNFDKLKDFLEKIAEKICEKKQDQTVCSGAVTAYGDILFNSVLDRAFNAYHVCEKLFLCPHTTHKEHVKEYIKEVLKDKPAFNVPTPTGKSTYTILHFSDPHVDLEYDAGTDAFCSEPLCCRAQFGQPTNPAHAAQFWGTHSKCDIPRRTFDQFLEFVSKNFNIDMIVWTGDNIAHNIWEQSPQTQTANTLALTQDLIKYFPNSYIYPMFGNHEPFPCDNFDFIGNNSAWLTSSLASMWNVWLDEDALNTLRQHSYYAIENSEHNVKVLALDTVACDDYDFYLIEDPTDPQGQLAWMREQLYDSEAKNQSVFIIGHIPPGSNGCDSQWSVRYTALVDRFANTIRLQLFGHSHQDQLEIVRSYVDDSPVGVVFITPSLTTFSEKNPSFRIYEIDAETHQPVNYYQYRLDLNKWNKNTTGPIEWDLAYDVLSVKRLDEYNLTDMSFKSFDDLVDKFQSNGEPVSTYLYNKASGTKNPPTNLTEKDLRHIYCDVKHSVSEENFKCLGFDATVNDVISIAKQLIPGGWSFNDC